MRIRSENRFITVQKGNYASQCQQYRNMTLKTYYLENRNSLCFTAQDGILRSATYHLEQHKTPS